MEVSNWEKWQTYRSDRNTPPWIKVYRNLLSNPEWAVLTDSEKGQLVSIWILAADKGGTIPDNPILIQKMCMLDDKPDINRFAVLGFLTPCCQPDGNQVVTDCPQDDAPDKTRLDKTRLETDEKQIVISSPIVKNKYSEEFELFWKAYPNHRRGNKKRAFANWKKIDPCLYLNITRHVDQRRTLDADWQRDGGKYIIHAEGFLSGERWEDVWTPVVSYSEATRKTIYNIMDVDLNG